VLLTSRDTPDESSAKYVLLHDPEVG